MNLKDRLTEPAMAKLKDANIDYPVIIGYLFEDLEQLEFYTEMKWGTWSDLKTFTGATHPADVFTQEPV
jgi:hypothetical protein